MLIHFSLFIIGYINKISPITIITIVLFFDICFSLYNISNLSFTVVPAFCGCALICLIFFIKKTNIRKYKIYIILTTFLGYFIMVIHRKDTALCYLPYFIIIFVYSFDIKITDLKKSKYILLICGIFILLTTTLNAINKYATKYINGTNFIEYNKARVKYMDYPHDKYKDNPEIYNQVGWDSNLCYLVKDWFFMDERVTTDSFLYLSDNSHISNSYQKNIYNTLKKVINDSKQKYLLKVLTISVLLYFLQFIYNKKQNNLSTFIFNNMIFCLLFGYLLLKGRLPYRVMVVIIMPTILINILLLIEGHKKDKICYKSIISIVILLFSFIQIITIFDKDYELKKQEKINTSNTIDALLVSNPSNTYIISPLQYDDINPKTRYPYNTSNIIPFGGSSYNSKSFYLNLQYNHLNELSGEIFKNQNIYFICGDDIRNGFSNIHNTLLDLICIYLKTNYNAKGVSYVSHIDNIYVYQFVFDENEHFFTEYYDIEKYILIN